MLVRLDAEPGLMAVEQSLIVCAQPYSFLAVHEYGVETFGVDSPSCYVDRRYFFHVSRSGVDVDDVPACGDVDGGVGRRNDGVEGVAVGEQHFLPCLCARIELQTCT